MPPRLAPPHRRVLILLCLVAALGGMIRTPAAAAPLAGEASGLLETPEQAFATAMRQSIGAPARADLGDQARVRLSDLLIVMPREPAAKFLAVTHRPVPDHFVALLLGPDGINTPGYVSFVPSGFIDADSALAWTEDDILDSLRDTVERANAALAAKHLDAREVRRWVRAPHYDPQARQLTWAALIVPKSAPRESGGEVTVHALAFGRDGYIELSLVTSVEQAGDVGRTADSFLNGLSFVPGKAYGDAQPSDPRAAGGLAAAMGIDSLHKAASQASFWSSDRIVPVAGAIVAAIGALSLFVYVQRNMRREARRG